MAKSPPSFDLFPHDLIASTSHLTPEAFGAYMRLLCHQWMHGSVPRDARKIARIVGAFGEQELTELMAEVLPFFDESDGGGLVQSRMEKDREAAIKRWEDRKAAGDVHRECGRLGGRPKRASMTSINQTETILVSESKPNQNQIGSSLGNQNETKTKPNAGRGKREEGILLDSSESSENRTRTACVLEDSAREAPQAPEPPQPPPSRSSTHKRSGDCQGFFSEEYFPESHRRPELHAAWTSWLTYVIDRDGRLLPASVDAWAMAATRYDPATAAERLSESVSRLAKGGPYWTESTGSRAGPAGLSPQDALAAQIEAAKLKLAQRSREALNAT